MKTFSQFQEDVRYRDPSARGGLDPRFDRKGKPDLGRGPSRWQIPDRSPTLGMDKMERTRETMLRKRFNKPVSDPIQEDSSKACAKNGQCMPSFSTPGTKDKMPMILDKMPTPLEIRKKNFFKKGSIA